MRQKLYNINLPILLVLFLIGFLVHFRSFQMVPYGDDWTFIYDYLANDHKPAHVNINYPGPLSFLTPYGPAILTIGLVYQFFGKTYFIYYLIPLIFKTLTAFILFLILQNISSFIKQKNHLINFLMAALFLTGFTGIQSIDWSMNMNVYVGLFIFALGLFYHSKFYLDKRVLNLSISSFLFLLSIVIAPTRFTPLILIIPLIDLVSLSWVGYSLLKALLIKNIIFAVVILIFLEIGIFGEGPGKITNTTLIYPFIQTFLSDPIYSFSIFLHWIGITYLPIYPSSNIFKTVLGGSLFLILLIIAYYKSRNKWLIIGSIMYFITLLLMWLSSTLLKIEDADSRHLLILFFVICLLMGIISMSLKFKKTFVFLFLILIIGHIYWVDKIYSHWLATGRSKDFIIPVQEKIMSNFPIPITEPKIIFLDFDDSSFQQSIEFGLSYRVAVLSGTRGLNNFPLLVSNKKKLMEILFKQLKEESLNHVVDNVYYFKLRNKIFTDATYSFRQEIKMSLKQQ